MPKVAVVKKDYPKRQPALLVPFILTVVKMMTDNKYFPKPTVVLDALTEIAATLQAAYINRKNGKNAKEICRLTLLRAVEMLDDEADYVSSVAKGNVDVITSAGFTPTKTTGSKSVAPQTPKAPVLENVNSELRISTEKVHGAVSYCWIVFTGEPQPIFITDSQLNFGSMNNVIILPAGSSRECVRGLVRGTKVTVQVLAQNSAGKSGLSAAVTIGIA